MGKVISFQYSELPFKTCGNNLVVIIVDLCIRTEFQVKARTE